MKRPEHPHNEENRVKAIAEYHLLDALDDKEYDDIVSVASEICQTPIALITIVESDKQKFIARKGIAANETHRDISFCGHAINRPDEIMIVPDARVDERFHDNPLVIGEPNVVFYAGIPLVDENGYALGTICVADNTPRNINEKQIKALRVLSRKIVGFLSLKKRNQELESEQNYLFEALNNSTPFFLHLRNDGTILHHGKNFLKTNPELAIGQNFEDYFTLEGKQKLTEIFTSDKSEGKLFFFVTKDRKQRYKCSLKHYGTNSILLFSTAVINTDFPIAQYRINLNDFPKQDYISEYLFLQQAATRGLEDSRKLNESLRVKNTELEKAKQDLISVNSLLEEKINERTKKIKNLALFPEQNPNPVYEIDIINKSVSYKNPASRTFIEKGKSFSYEDTLKVLQIEEEILSQKINQKKEFEFEGRYYERNLFFSENESIRVYLHDITLIREKEKQERLNQEKFLHQQQSLLQFRNLENSISLNDKLKFILRGTAEILDCGRCSMWIYDERNQSIVSDLIYLKKEDTCVTGMSLYAKDFPGYFKALKTREVILATDAETHEATREFAEVYLRPLNIVSMLDIPLIKSNQLTGVLCNEYIGTKKEFSDSDINFARSVADALVLALETEQVNNSNKKLAEANSSLKESYEQLVNLQSDIIKQEKLATLGTLISGIAHEINTPLGAIKASNDNINDTFISGLIELTSRMSSDEIKKGIELFFHHNKRNYILTTREERSILRNIEKEIQKSELKIENSYFFASKIYELGYHNVENSLLEFIEHPKSFELFTFATNLTRVLKSVDTIGLAVDRATRVVRALNNFSHGNISGEISNFSLKENIEGVITILWNRIKQGSKVALNIENDVFVVGNQEELSQVWTNFINNAIQAANGKCSIDIQYSKKENYHQVIFSNNGPMIPADILPKIFDPFFSTKKRGEGTGLGLNIVKKIIEKHNGKIYCESNPEKTSFFVELPFQINPINEKNNS
jgi:signal transduction histidine kinase